LSSRRNRQARRGGARRGRGAAQRGEGDDGHRSFWGGRCRAAARSLVFAAYCLSAFFVCALPSGARRRSQSLWNRQRRPGNESGAGGPLEGL